MALRLAGVTPSSPLDQPAFAADGSAARLRTSSSTMTIAQDERSFIFAPYQIDAAPMSFVPPDAEAIRAGSEPAVAAEVTLAQILPVGSNDTFNGAGASEVSVELRPDEKDPAWSWPYLTFHALGIRPMVLSYRVTVLTVTAADDVS